MTVTTSDPAELATMRHAMVASQLRTNAVSDPRIVAAMARVPREDFLPGASADLVYRDTAVPLGEGRSANLPIAIGRLLTEAYLLPSDRVLLIGAAGGYTAAVLASLVQGVVAVEQSPALAANARRALGGLSNVVLIEGPLAEGHAEGAPYDVLIVDGAVSAFPDSLVSQVRAGGRVVAGLIDRGITRLAAGRKSDGGFALLAFADIDCVTLPGFEAPQCFQF